MFMFATLLPSLSFDDDAASSVSSACNPAVAVATTTLVLAIVVSYLLWRMSESARVRKIVRGAGGSLPTVVPLLPKWLGFVGGHTLMMKQEEMVQQLEDWADELGGDYELRAFGNRVVVVTGLVDIRRILTLRPSRFKRGLTETQIHWAAIQTGVAPSMFFDEGKEWGRSRRLISPSLNGHNIAAMLPIMTEIGERLCAELSVQADAGEAVDAIPSFERFAHDVIALAAFGFDADSIGASKHGGACQSYDSMKVIVLATMDLMVQPLAILGWVTLPWMLPWVRRVREHSSQLRDAVQGTIDAIRRETEETGTASSSSSSGADDTPLHGGALLRKMVGVSATSAVGNDAAEAAGGGGRAGLSNRMAFSDDEVLRQAMGLFIAGTATTALPLSWSMYYLAKNPEIFARCREEALRVAPLSDGMISTSEELSQLVYCSAVFKETLRLRTAGAFIFLHNTEEHTMESGTKLEAGTGVIVLTRRVSLSEDAFTRPTDFVPERWIEAEREEALLGKAVGNGDSDACRVRHTEQAILSFGGGPRVCPGKYMANTEAAIVLAAICARFDISLAPGQADPPEEILTFTVGPRAVKLVLTRRTA